MKVVLVACGGSLDLIGIVLVALPEIEPRFRNASGAALAAARRLVDVLGIRRNAAIYGSTATGSISLGGHASGIVSVGADADLDRKVAFLLTRNLESQRRLNELERKVNSFPGEWRNELATKVAELEERMRDAIEQSRETRIRARLFGIACLATGSVLLSIANLV